MKMAIKQSLPCVRNSSLKCTLDNKYITGNGNDSVKRGTKHLFQWQNNRVNTWVTDQEPKCCTWQKTVALLTAKCCARHSWTVNSKVLYKTEKIWTANKASCTSENSWTVNRKALYTTKNSWTANKALYTTQNSWILNSKALCMRQNGLLTKRYTLHKTVGLLTKHCTQPKTAGSLTAKHCTWGKMDC